jgi:Fe-S cluster biosynthesis and repair protein YggX
VETAVSLFSPSLAAWAIAGRATLIVNNNRLQIAMKPKIRQYLRMNMGPSPQETDFMSE